MWLIVPMGLIIASWADGDLNARPDVVHVRIQKSIFEFGEPIDVFITYENRGTEPLRLDEPQRSPQTALRWTALDRKLPRALGIPIAKVLRTETPNGFKLDRPRSIPMTIEPGGHYAWSVDIFEYYTTGFIEPGRWSLWYEDRKYKLESPKVEFEVRFTSKSVEWLLEIAENEQLAYFKRGFASGWLRKLKPDFRLSLPVQRVSPEEYERLQVENRAQIAAFRQFWDENADSPEVREAIHDIQHHVPHDAARALRKKREAEAREKAAAEERKKNLNCGPNDCIH